MNNGSGTKPPPLRIAYPHPRHPVRLNTRRPRLLATPDIVNHPTEGLAASTSRCSQSYFNGWTARLNREVNFKAQPRNVEVRSRSFNALWRTLERDQTIEAGELGDTDVCYAV
ncbi:hypothetical protein PGT21_016836 [Puccinia graminis f. sp. tritici]|uniref:Uncharacterized protein n=1 Tax=Puccinia graminis f. sp. tritici TaxID=56615 RepID=A0A5B0MJB6_PUCGR|nr:hypothetical protein PGT21_016836 [Puccinia graminis f. sp. tritici]KAA1122147.1 hypothetical protein PGTUg99_030139 [Puccinia graminis f. sp. tritici]KAA1126886.1 hypothetical protein PGTUg99_030239 [Puccinia graminis f. sp. tritici]